MWTTPKVDWKSSDFYNIEDWRRVRSNLEHLRSVLIERGTPVTALLPTETDKGYNELPYVHLVNNMEENLEVLREAFGTDFTEDVSRKTWYARVDVLYSSNPTYNDWNRWELILLRIYESIQYIDTYLYSPISGTCYSGSDRTLIRFSRGR